MRKYHLKLDSLSDVLLSRCLSFKRFLVSLPLNRLKGELIECCCCIIPGVFKVTFSFFQLSCNSLFFSLRQFLLYIFSVLNSLPCILLRKKQHFGFEKAIWYFNWFRLTLSLSWRREREKAEEIEGKDEERKKARLDCTQEDFVDEMKGKRVLDASSVWRRNCVFSTTTLLVDVGGRKIGWMLQTKEKKTT